MTTIQDQFESGLVDFDNDTSSVYSIEMLDSDCAKALAHLGPWLFDTNDEGVKGFPDEDAACAAQRQYRTARGFDPITGAKR